MIGMTADHAPAVSPALSLYREIDRAEWSRLAAGMAQPLVRDRGRADPRPRRPTRHGRGAPRSTCRCRGCSRCTPRPRSDSAPTPRRSSRIRLDDDAFVVAVAGSVAVGKSTIARLLRELMSRWPGTPRVELVTTDGFLYPNAELERRGLMSRKGFPESYDRRALVLVPHRGQERGARGARAVLLAHAVRHRARCARDGAATRCRDRRGSERAAAAADARTTSR